MIELKINWKDIHIMSTYCYENLFFNNAIPENLIKARKNGFILSTILNTSIMSMDLPNFIQNRIPNKTDFISYIKSTHALLETDDISIDIIENQD